MTSFGIGASYSVKKYRDDYYKIIRFSSPRCPRLLSDSQLVDDREEVEGKFSQSISRAKSVIYQVAVCNDWDYFCTFTINKENFDRYDFKPFYKAFTQWLRDYRKKYKCKIEYLLVPEQHQDGAWHLHGLMRGIPSDHLSLFVPGLHPQKLVDGRYLNWGRASTRFGFCSLDTIRDPMAVAGYVTKYITKDLLESNNRFGAHLYFCSIGLRRAVSMGFIYGRFAELDSRLSNFGHFCDTGWVTTEDWTFWFDYFSDPMESLEPLDTFSWDIEDEEYLNFGQLSLFDREGERYEE